MDFLEVRRRLRDQALLRVDEPGRVVVPLKLARLGAVDVARREDLVRVADPLQALHLRRKPRALDAATFAVVDFFFTPVQRADAHRVPRRHERPVFLAVDDAREDAVEAVPDLVDVAEGLEEVADDGRVGLGVVDDLDAGEVFLFEGDVVVDLGVSAFFLVVVVLNKGAREEAEEEEGGRREKELNE